MQHTIAEATGKPVAASPCAVAGGSEAIGAATSSGDPALVAAALALHGFRAFDLGRVAAVRAALDLVPDDVSARHPSVLAMKGMVASLDERFDLADSWFHMALEARDGSRTSIVVRYGLDLVRRGRTDAIEFLLGEIEPSGPAEGEAAELWALLATAYVGAHRIDDARLAARKALNRTYAVADPGVRARIFHQAAYVALNDGDGVSAKDLAVLALEHADAAGLHDLAARALSVLHNIAIGLDDDPVAARGHLVRLAECARKSAVPALALYATMNMYEIEVDAGNVVAISALDAGLAELRIFLSPMAGESLLPAQALCATWEGRFDHAYALLAPSAERQFDDDRRAMRWAEVAAYAAAAGMRAESARAIRKSRAGLRKVDATDRSALRAQAFLAIAEILLAHDGRARTAIAGLRAVQARGGPRFIALVDAVRALYVRWAGSGDAPYPLADALERLERVAFGGIARFIEALSLPTSPQGRVALLSELEKSILRSVASGQTSKEIAAELGRSSQTVDVHIRTICRKLGCSGRRRAVVFAAHAGSIDERRTGGSRSEGEAFHGHYPIPGSARIATISYAP